MGRLSEMQRAMRYDESSQYSSQAVSEALSSLQRIEKSYRDFLAGLPVSPEIGSGYDGSYNVASPRIAELKVDLIKLILPASLGLPEETHFNKNETVSEFLARVYEAGQNAEDYELCMRVVGFQSRYSQYMNYDNLATYTLQSYRAAKAYYDTGDYFLAAVNFHSTLSKGSNLIPSKKVGEYLQKIKAEHPEDYEKAEKVIASPSQLPPNFFEDLRRSMYSQSVAPNASSMPPEVSIKEDKKKEAETKKKEVEGKKR